MTADDPNHGSLDELAERVARRVVDLLQDDAPTADRLLTVAEKARQLGVSADYCREHWRELEGIELPAATATGKRPRRVLRFPADPPTIPAPATAPPARAVPRRRPTRTRDDLLPIKRAA